MPKIVSLMSAVFLTLTLAACDGGDKSQPAPSDTVDLPASDETAAVDCAEDLASDPVVWVNPDDLAQSLIIGAGTQDGLVVNDHTDTILYRTADGRMQTVDLRAGYPITTANGNPDTAVPTIIVAATNRTTNGISVYALDRDTGVLGDVMVEPIPASIAVPNGVCLYRSAVNGKLYLYATSDDGTVSQWQLYDNGLGQLRSTIQRIWPIGSAAAGCVADDANGAVFIAEPGVGIWRYGAEPKDSFTERTAVAAAGQVAGRISGLALYPPSGSESAGGYVIASSPASSTFAVFDLKAPHAYRGRFRVTGNEAKGVDGAERSSGLDLVSGPLGPLYPAGLLVVQDSSNTTPDGSAANQNFKLVSWADVAAALGLD